MTGDNSFGQFGDGSTDSKVNFTDPCGLCDAKFYVGWFATLKVQGESSKSTGRNDVKKKKKKIILD